MPSRKRDEVLELMDLVENAMLQGYTTPPQIVRTLGKSHGITAMEARSYIGHVRRRWARTAVKDRDEQRAMMIELNQNALRQTYGALREARQLMGKDAVAETNKALNNIRAILSQIAELYGLKERTLRVGGDKEGVPIQIQEQQSQVLVLEQMVTNGILDQTAVANLKAAILSGRIGPGTTGPGSVRVVDAGSPRLPAPQGDYPGGGSDDQG